MSYTPTGKPLDITRALASEVRDEFILVAAAINEFPSATDTVSGRANYAADTGTANAYAVTADPLITSYTAGLTLLVKAANANTGASTIYVNALGLRSIVRADGTALQAGDIVASQIFQISYDLANTRFQLSATGAAASATAAASSASAAASSASAAATSASDAGLSELNSARSANDSIALYDNFDRRYLGDKSSAPSLDNQGNALIVGAIYFDTVLAIMRVWSGSAWANVVTNNPGLVLLSASVISASTATADILVPTGYDEYLLSVQDVVPVTNGSSIFLRTSSDGGATFDSGGSDYQYLALFQDTGTPTPSGSAATGSSIFFANSTSNNAAHGGASGDIRLISPGNAIGNKIIRYQSASCSSSTAYGSIQGTGQRVSAADIDAVRLFFNGSNIASGKFKLYGLRKS